jgi:hypothetical protein
VGEIIVESCHVDLVLVEIDFTGRATQKVRAISVSRKIGLLYLQVRLLGTRWLRWTIVGTSPTRVEVHFGPKKHLRIPVKILTSRAYSMSSDGRPW